MIRMRKTTMKMTSCHIFSLLWYKIKCAIDTIMWWNAIDVERERIKKIRAHLKLKMYCSKLMWFFVWIKLFENWKVRQQMSKVGHYLVQHVFWNGQALSFFLDSFPCFWLRSRMAHCGYMVFGFAVTRT